MLPIASGLQHPSGRRGYATAQDAPSARVSAPCAAPLSSPNPGPAPHFGVEQPVDDEDRPFDPPYLAQRQGKIVLARIGGELPQELAGRDGSGGHGGCAAQHIGPVSDQRSPESSVCGRP